MRSGRRTLLTGVVTAVILVGAPVASVRAQTTLDFEDPAIPVASTITTQFAARGVLFHGNFLDTDPNASSGGRVLRAIKPATEVFVVTPMVVTFTSPQARVKLFGGSQFASLNGTLTAFDSGGNVVATDGPRLVTQNTFTTAFEVTTAAPAIVRVDRRPRVRRAASPSPAAAGAGRPAHAAARRYRGRHPGRPAAPRHRGDGHG